RREVEDRVRVAPQGLLDHVAGGEIAGDALEALAGARGKADVEETDARIRVLRPQGGGQARADEAAATCDQDIHGFLPRPRAGARRSERRDAHDLDLV